MFTLPPISSEQQAILDALKEDCNVVVDSVAGSGKTTTLLYLAQSLPDTRFLVITYNSKLKLETRTKVDALGLSNVEVHSYHSLGYKYYSTECITDQGIINVVLNKHMPQLALAFDVLVLDEVQDMTPCYYQLVHKVVLDNTCAVRRVCVIGDRYQSIYRYNDADERFITYASSVFDFVNGLPWKHLMLTVTYRVPAPVARFINDAALQCTRLHTARGDTRTGRVTYMVSTTFCPYRAYNWIVENVLQSCQVAPDDIFVLAPTVKKGRNDSPVRLLANMISNMDIPIFVPTSEDEALDSDVLQGKVVFSTFHQVKGLERKVVILFNFDASYFKFYNKSARCDVCPNELYVAMTRAQEHLIVLHQKENPPLPFLNTDVVLSHAEFESHVSWDSLVHTAEKEETAQQRLPDIAVTDAIKHLSAKATRRALQFFTVEQLRAPSQSIHLPNKVQQEQGSCENVGDITGVAVPAYYEYQHTGTMSIVTALQTEDKTFDATYVLPSRVTPEELLRLATQYLAMRSGYTYRQKQIQCYDWVSQDRLEQCVERFNSVIQPSAQTCYEVRAHMMVLGGRRLVGYMDCVDAASSTVWEIKCGSQLKHEHMIQLAMYAGMNASVNTMTYKLYNVLTDEVLQIVITPQEAQSLVDYIMSVKYAQPHTCHTVSDDDFMAMTQELRS